MTFEVKSLLSHEVSRQRASPGERSLNQQQHGYMEKTNISAALWWMGLFYTMDDDMFLKSFTLTIDKGAGEGQVELVLG